MIHDLAIIGGGPAGYTTAERAAANGLKVILFEKKALGGVCLNEGCIPTKTLLYSAKMLANARNATKYGICIEGNTTFDLSKILVRKTKTVRKLTAGIRQRLKSHNVTIIEGLAQIKGQDEENQFLINCNDETFAARKTIICAGSETIIPPIRGLNEINYWTSKEALNCSKLPDTLTIVGGGVIGTEFAYYFHTLGVRVTVIEMLPEILGNMDNESSAMLRAELTKAGVIFYLDAKVLEVSPERVIVEKDGEQIEVQTHQILLSTGRRPSIAGLGIEALNIELYNKGLKVNQFMQTSNPDIYACGDVTGYSLLAHTATREAEVAVNHILGLEDSMSYKAIPSVVYTNPEIAGIGETEVSLEAKGASYKVYKLPMSYSGRFVAENELANGICKLIADEHNVVVGCHIVGNPASELISIAGIAIEKEYTVNEFRRIIFPHPTVGEIIHETLFS